MSQSHLRSPGSAGLITRRSQVQILPPLLQRPCRQGLYSAGSERDRNFCRRFCKHRKGICRSLVFDAVSRGSAPTMQPSSATEGRDVSESVSSRQPRGLHEGPSWCRLWLQSCVGLTGAGAWSNCSSAGNGGGTRPHRSRSPALGRDCAVDVLVEPARVGACVACTAAVAVLRAALMDVGGVAVVVA